MGPAALRFVLSGQKNESPSNIDDENSAVVSGDDSGTDPPGHFLLS